MSNFNINNIAEEQIFSINGEEIDIKIYNGITSIDDKGEYYYTFFAKVYNKKDVKKLFNIYKPKSTKLVKLWKCFILKSKEKYPCYLKGIDFVNEVQDIDISTLGGGFDSIKMEYKEATIEIVIMADKNGNIKIEKEKTEKINKNELKIDVEKLKLEAKKKKAKKRAMIEKKQEQIEIEKNKKNKFRLIRFKDLKLL